MKLKDEFLMLKEHHEQKKRDIAEKLGEFINDPTRSSFKSKYGNMLYDDLIPEALKLERGSDLSFLLEKKAKKADKKDKDILTLLSKVVRKKLSTNKLPSTLALTATELLLIGAYVAKDDSTKRLLKSKAKHLIGISTSLSETYELKETSRAIFNLDERLTLEVPERYEKNELARIINDKLNNILSLPENEQLKLLDNLLNKINEAIADESCEVEEDDFAVLHHYQSEVIGRIDIIEDTGSQKI